MGALVCVCCTLQCCHQTPMEEHTRLQLIASRWYLDIYTHRNAKYKTHISFAVAWHRFLVRPIVWKLSLCTILYMLIVHWALLTSYTQIFRNYARKKPEWACLSDIIVCGTSHLIMGWLVYIVHRVGWYYEGVVIYVW